MIVRIYYVLGVANNWINKLLERTKSSTANKYETEKSIFLLSPSPSHIPTPWCPAHLCMQPIVQSTYSPTSHNLPPPNPQVEIHIHPIHRYILQYCNIAMQRIWMTVLSSGICCLIQLYCIHESYMLKEM